MKNIKLGELEREVMEIIWQHKSCTVRDVLIVLQGRRKIAYTTVATILHRLSIKGMVLKKKAGTGDVYQPKVSKESHSKRIAGTFLNEFIDSYGSDALASFADTVDKLPKDKKEYFLSLLDDYEKIK